MADKRGLFGVDDVSIIARRNEEMRRARAGRDNPERPEIEYDQSFLDELTEELFTEKAREEADGNQGSSDSSG